MSARSFLTGYVIGRTILLMAQKVKTPQKWLRPVATLLFVALVVFFILHNRSAFAQSISVLGQASKSTFWFSLPLVALTFVMAAFSYSFLAFRTLRLRELLIVELAAAGINRIVPSGLGGLGVHGLYLHKHKHSIAQATTTVSINNLLGLVVHLGLLVLLMAIGKPRWFHLGWSIEQRWILLGICLVLCGAALVWLLRVRCLRFARNLLHSLSYYRRQPRRVLYASISLLAMTLTNLLILHLAARSFGIWIDVPTLFAVYTLGVLIGAAVPTPGGLAGVEAGLAGGFLACGIDEATAIAIALAFRIATYWLPVLPGLAVFVYCRNQKII